MFVALQRLHPGQAQEADDAREAGEHRADANGNPYARGNIPVGQREDHCHRDAADRLSGQTGG